METRWSKLSRSLLGTREIVGPKHSPTILGWCKTLGAAILGITVKDDETAWCGTFMAWVFYSVGIKPPKIAVRAKAWAAWGVALKFAVPGAVLVFDRAGGGHVGEYVKENKTAYLVRGGNQGNAVSEVWIEKARCVAIRWPAGEPLPTSSPVVVTASGKVSTNEA